MGITIQYDIYELAILDLKKHRDNIDIAIRELEAVRNSAYRGVPLTGRVDYRLLQQGGGHVSPQAT